MEADRRKRAENLAETVDAPSPEERSRRLVPPEREEDGDPGDGSHDGRAVSLTLSTGAFSVLRLFLDDSTNILHPETRVELSGRRPKARDDDPPERIGRFQVIGEIARGGIGVVYRVQDDDVGRDIALKVLLPRSLEDPDMIRRFVEEAQICGQLQHPNIVPVHELGLLEDDLPYFTMKLVKGRTLASHLSQADGMTRDRLVSVFRHVCQALGYAHSRGVVHRDLKPANVMVGAFGEVQVMDWGMAKVLSEGGVADERDAHATPPGVTEIKTVRSEGLGSESMVGSVRGTPSYMAPEQARGRLDLVDERSDVFGLGAILCEILTGKPPFTGRTVEEILWQACAADLAPAFDRLDACDAEPDLVEIAKLCLAPEPRARPRSAAIVAERVSGHIANVEQRAQDAEAAEAAARIAARGELRARRLWVAISIAACLIVLLVPAGIAWRRSAESASLAITVADVNNINEQTRRLRGVALEGGEDLVVRWREAYESARSAGLRAARLPSGHPLHGRVEELRGTIAGELENAKRESSARTRRLAFESAVESVQLLALETPDPRDRSTAMEEAFRSLLEWEVFDPLRPAALAEALESLGATVPGIRGLEEWAVALGEDRESGKASEFLRRGLLEAASILDPDETRVRYRSYLAEWSWRDVQIAAREIQDLSAKSQHAREDIDRETVELVASALRAWRDDHKAREILRIGVALYPESLRMQHDLGVLTLEARKHDPEHPDPGWQDESTRYFRACVALRPRSSRAWRNLAEILRRSGDLDGAKSAYDQALEFGDESAEVHRGIAKTLLGMGDVAGALSAIERSLEKRGDEVDALFERGEIRELLGNRAEAEASFAEVIRIRPDHVAAHVSLGRVAASPRTSIEALRAAVALDPDHAEARFLFGRELYRQRNDESACEHLEKAIAIRPRHARARHALGMARFRQGRARDAFESILSAWLLDEAFEVSPSSIRSHGETGEERRKLRASTDLVETEREEALSLLGELESADLPAADLLALKGLLHDRENREGMARGLYRQALERDPEHVLGRALLGSLLTREGKVDEGLALARAAVESDPFSSVAQNNLGCVLAVASADASRRASASRHFVDAAECFRAAIRRDEEAVWPRYNLAQLLIAHDQRDRGTQELRELFGMKGAAHPAVVLSLADALHSKRRMREALSICRRLLRDDPANDLVTIRIADYYRHQGRFEESIACYLRMLEADPVRAHEYHDDIGRAHTLSGNLREARAAYQKAVELAPDSALAHQGLGIVYQYLEDHESALSSYRRAIDLDPKSAALKTLEVNLERKPDIYSTKSLSELVGSLDALLRDVTQRHTRAARVLILAWRQAPDSLSLDRVIEIARGELEAARTRTENDFSTRAEVVARYQLILADLLEQSGSLREAIALLEGSRREFGVRAEVTRRLESLRKAASPDLPTFESVDAALATPGIIVPEGASWRFWRGAREPSPGLSWTAAEFDDESWDEGTSPFAAGLETSGTPIDDLIGVSSTLYLRAVFPRPDVDVFERLILSVIANDGFVAYLNGKELARVRTEIPDGPVPHDGVASESVGARPEAMEIDIAFESLTSGSNVLAIQGLNRAVGNTTFLLNPVLRGTYRPHLERDRARFSAFLSTAEGDPDRQHLVDYLDARILARNGDHVGGMARIGELIERRPEVHLLTAYLESLEHTDPEPGRNIERARLTRLVLLTALDVPDELWTDWIIQEFSLGRSPDEILGDFPRPSEGEKVPRSQSREDVFWLLERLTSGESIRINCGGLDHEDHQRRTWSHDRFFRDGSVWGDYIPGSRDPFTGEIGNTDDDVLYRSERYVITSGGTSLVYRIPLPPGRYEVILHFAELIEFARAEDREFDVTVEGDRVLERYSPGNVGFASAEVHRFVTVVKDGALDIGAAMRRDNPKFSAIEIAPLAESDGGTSR